MQTKEQVKAHTRAYHQAHKEQAKAMRQPHLKRRASDRTYAQAHQGKLRAYNRAYNQAIFVEALRVLGDRCSCPGCEVSEPAFLTIDHINGRSKGLRQKAVKEARASGWDKTKFQILCANCNHAKHDQGFCPVHQTDLGQKNGHNPGANAQLGFDSL